MATCGKKGFRQLSSKYDPGKMMTRLYTPRPGRSRQCSIFPCTEGGVMLSLLRLCSYVAAAVQLLLFSLNILLNTVSCACTLHNTKLCSCCNYCACKMLYQNSCCICAMPLQYSCRSSCTCAMPLKYSCRSCCACAMPLQYSCRRCSVRRAAAIQLSHLLRLRNAAAIQPSQLLRLRDAAVIQLSQMFRMRNAAVITAVSAVHHA